MKKTLLLISCILLITCSVATSQTRVISGVIVDSEGMPLEGVYVTYSVKGKTNGTKSDGEGTFRLQVVFKDSVLLNISHLNYMDTSVLVRKQEAERIIGISMRKKTKVLGSVIVSAESRNGNLKGDTTVYYAKAYKTNKDATAYDLIQKLPGVGINDGNVQAHGESVSEVLIDGKEYTDITMALKNLPAYVVNEVQIYYKGSDYSQLTGFDDGNREMIINFSTKSPEKEKLMGRVQLGYGTDNRHDIYGNLNWFKQQHRLSLFSQFNNINKQDYSGVTLIGNGSENTPGVSPYSKGRANGSSSMGGAAEEHETSTDGITTTRAAGMNYSFVPKDSSVNFTLHYLYSNTDKDLEYKILDKFFVDSVEESQNQIQNVNRESHRVKSKVEWNISSRDVVVFRPEMNIQRSVLEENVSVVRDSGLPIIQQSTTEEKALLGTGTLTYLHRIGERGAALSLDFKGGYLKDRQKTQMGIEGRDTAGSVLRDMDDNNKSGQLDGVLSFVTPSIMRYNRVKFDFGVGMKNRRNNIMANQGRGEDSMIIDSMSSGEITLENRTLTGRMVYMYSRRKVNFVGGMEMIRDKQNTMSMRFGQDTAYLSMHPFAQLRYSLNAKNQIHVNYISRQLTPSTDKLQEAVRVVNPTLCVVGTPLLRPATSQDVSARWLHNDVSQSRFVVFFVKYGEIKDYHAMVRTIQGGKNGEEVQMVGYRNSEKEERSLELLGAYGFPFRLMKSNVNVSSYWRVSEVPGYFGSMLAKSNVMCWNNSLTIGSNVSERLDFVIDMNASYNKDVNDISKNNSVNYWSYSCGGQLVIRMGKWLKCMVECGYTGYNGEELARYNAVISNAAISSIFGKREEFEVQLSVNDIFNQNNNFYQSTSELYMRESESNVLKRYFMLKLIYKFNKQK